MAFPAVVPSQLESENELRILVAAEWQEDC